MIYHDNIIVGGGASGLMAAIVAKDLGKDVAIVESTDRVGRKILTTGNGRCNISNAKVASPFINYHSQNDNFYNFCLENFNIEDTKNLFLALGLPLTQLENGRLYPQSFQASSVVDILRLALEEKNIPVYTNCKVETIHKNKCFNLSTNNEEHPLFTCNKVVLACGGKSAVKTGSDGSGYGLAKKLGHSVIPTLPAIVQLKLKYDHLKGLSGIKFDGTASVVVNNEIIRCEKGEILFTDYGISGPPILQISRIASKSLYEKKNVKIVVDMMPESSQDDIDNFIYGHLAMLSHRSISNALIGVINKKLIPIFLKDIGIQSIHTPCCELDWKYTDLIAKRLKKWEFECIDTNGFNSAQLTQGGINTKEVDNKTLESKITKGLYFCGEILDVNGDCGGFNLQWAWSSGALIGNSL